LFCCCLCCVLMSDSSSCKPLRVGIFHPDLGIGGAERLVVDIGMALKKNGCDVTFFTSHHDHDHCFPETLDGSMPVVVAGDWMPRHIFGRLNVLFAVLRSLWLIFYVFFNKARFNLDVAVIDQLSVSVPIAQKLLGCKVLFYCHFPDKLLSTRAPAGGGESDPSRIAEQSKKQLSLLKRIYRAPFDFLEERTTGCADLVMVNSNFTRQVFAAAFPSIKAAPTVLYPTVSLKDLPETVSDEERECLPLAEADKNKKLIVSINRFERKKDIMLALEAYAIMRDEYAAAFEQTKLVLAGGYDPLVEENVQYYEELCKRSEALGLTDHVVLLTNFNNLQRTALLRRAACLVYTPQNEHFGIVPVEAMFSSVPVVASNSGGPLESVIEGKCGFLREPKPAEFAEAISRIVLDPQLQETMGREARKNAVDRFSFDSFAKQLFSAVSSLVQQQ